MPPGAKPGNRNAFKHGFYARLYTPDERYRLTKSGDDLVGEINTLRIVIDRIFERLSAEGLSPGKTGELGDNTLKTINTLVNASLTLATVARSNEIQSNKYRPVEQAIFDALAELNAEDGI